MRERIDLLAVADCTEEWLWGGGDFVGREDRTRGLEEAGQAWQGAAMGGCEGIYNRF